VEQAKRSRAPFGFRFVAPLALGSTLNPINSTMLATALVPIADALHANASQTGWIIASLYLTTAVAQPMMGRLVDLFGPRRIYLVSLFFVAAAGVFGHWAWSLSSLVLVRVLLGLGTSGAYPSAMRMFREEADRIGAEPPRIAMGVLSLSAITTMAAGPVIGGVLTGAFGWHSIFTVNLPLALLTVVLVLLWAPKDRPRTESFARLAQEVDFIGIALFTVFLLCLMTFLMYLKYQMLWLALGGAAVSGALLVLHSLRHRQPFIDVRMLTHNWPLTITFLRTGLVMLITYSVFYGFAQWLESAIGYSTTKAGLVTLPLSLAAAVSSVTGVRTKSLRTPFLISIGAALVGCICLFLIDSRSSVWIIAAAVMFFGVPMGMFSTATQAAVYIQAPPESIGTAAGLQRTAAYVGSIGAAALLAVMYGQRASDAGLHSLTTIIGTLSALLFVATIFDRTIPRVVLAASNVANRIPPASNEKENKSELV
jgi:MFS family permease